MNFPLFYSNIVNNVNSKSATINEDMVNILEQRKHVKPDACELLW